MAVSGQIVAGIAVCLVVACSAWATEPLHVRIDQWVDEARTGPVAPASDDAAFLRRVYLDLWGVIPTADEVRAFLEDASADKRARTIGRLLDDARFIRRMTLFFDHMLMERRNQKHIKAEEWRAWLYNQLASNRPLNEMLGEIIAADGTDENNRPAATFFLDRECEPHLLTRDVGRIYLGVDLQCAQCHDHPVIADYYQQDYYGLNAFLNRSSLFTDPKSKKAFVAEKAEGDTTYASVFIDGEKYTAAPHLPGEAPIDEPTFSKGEEYVVKPAKNVRPVPKFSRREALAEQFSSGQSRQFTRNLANRLWALMFGRGLVNPVDLHHGDNPPSHPQLLEVLTDELATMQYDLRAFLREIALSNAYQQSYRMPDGLLDLAPQAEQFVADAQSRVAEAEAAVSSVTDESLQLRDQLASAEAQVKATEEEMNQAQAAIAEAEKQFASANQARDEAKSAAAAKADAAKTVEQLAADAATVAAKLNEDAVVAEAAEKLQSHAQQLAAEAAQANQQAEQLAAKAQQAAQELMSMQTAMEQLAAKREEAANQLARVQEARETNDEQKDAARRELLAAQASLKDAEVLREYGVASSGNPDSEEAAAAASAKLSQRWSERAFIARIRPLEPEQFALSVLQATGLLAPRRAAAEKAAQEKQEKETKDQEKSSQSLSIAVEQEVHKQSQGDIQAFVSVLSHGEGPAAHEYEATVDEALFLANGSQLDAWLHPRPDNLAYRLKQLFEPSAVAEELYLSVLSRRPDEQEAAAVAEFLDGRSEEERAAALKEMIWGLLTSAEFRFNH